MANLAVLFLIFSQKAGRYAPTYRSLRGIFKKTYILFQFCVWTRGSTDKSTPHLDIRAMLQPFDWKWCQAKKPLFGFWLGHRKYWNKIYFLWLKLYLQLGWTCCAGTHKINLPWGREGYDAFEYTDEKLWTRHIHMCVDPNSIYIFGGIFKQ